MPLSKPQLLFFVTEDWYFLSHRMGLAKAMMEAGYDVSLITQVDKGAAEIEAAGIYLYPLHIKRSGMNLWREAKTFLRIVQIYHKVRPDIVHHVALKPVVYGAIAARLVGITRRVNALAGLGFVFSSYSWRARLIKPVVTLLLLIALSGKKARLIVQNADDVSFFKDKKLVLASSIRLVRGSGVDPSRFLPVPENLEQKPLIVLPARLLQDKGVGEFVDAAREIIKEKGALARFALVGQPDLQNPASFTPAQIAAWEKEGIVEYWGWREDMSEVFASANIACLPSYREGLPKSLLEAAACGRAIVTCDVPGCREIVKHKENGWLVPARDVAALAEALIQAIKQPDLRARYAKYSRKLIEEVFAEKYIYEQTLNIYREIQS